MNNMYVLYTFNQTRKNLSTMNYEELNGDDTSIGILFHFVWIKEMYHFKEI